ncbi:hypothetical protein PGT21_008705 [Puccinia graminis f. sp. tritici]|uniref:Uncharacterized protein n=1 Tax=Puccinia graminis f. sp. tritici TaxID=56615 RepID=A0A5B0LNU6_PUCGR|nr:hypothetical protein PGTUg99_011963 [Puccinia graminis f. sp. tritici]KAA1065736.1 hypothetical protein PGT21_008705 [Puccinia graminis f. sp. tritici]
MSAQRQLGTKKPTVPVQKLKILSFLHLLAITHRRNPLHLLPSDNRAAHEWDGWQALTSAGSSLFSSLIKTVFVMASLIVQYQHNLVANQRKEIINFGGYFLSLRDDQTVKNAAYSLNSRFIAVYDSLKMHWLLVAPKVQNQNSHLLPSKSNWINPVHPFDPQLDLK